MKLEKISIDKLKPATYNPRKKLKPSDKEYQKIKRSIEEFGYVDPIIANKDLTIIGGHQRMNVMKDMGFKEVDVVIIDVDKNKEKALNVALNKITGEWDYGKLGDLLLELDAENYDLAITGFDEKEIEDLMAPIDDVFEVEGKVEFTEVLGEEHNYIVLYFDNEVDYLQAESLLGLEKVRNLSTRIDGRITKGMESTSIGRVVKGREAIDKIRNI